MALTDILLSSLLSKQLTQYPDKNLYKAAVHLKPEEQPTAPVRLYDDANKLYEEVLRPIGGAPLTTRAIAVVPRDKSAIYVKRGTDEYKDPRLLATKLAHEQVHIKQSNADRAELPAYEKEMDVASRFGAYIPAEYRQALRNHVLGLRAKSNILEQELLKRQKAENKSENKSENKMEDKKE